ncbi:MAG: hypothetical protein SGJ27_00915 [Candidatus Melainabacteria bacterium]|nr:hypothetical protein [Candidatus Melainabacteria bacterium]
MVKTNTPNFKSVASKSILTAAMFSFLTQGTGIACSLTERQLPWQDVTNKANTTKMLTDYDVALLIDSSHSMKYEYVPAEDFIETISDINPNINNGSRRTPSSSRWEWCRAHTAQLTKDSMSVLNHGPRLTVFGDHSIMYKDVVNSESVAKVFTRLKPHGGTFAAHALSEEMNTYFRNRKKQGAAAKPLLIAMITDGSLSDLWSSRRALVSATKKMNRSDEIAIVILKVGEDPKAPQQLEQLDNELVSKFNAKFDIVEVKSFDELNSKGIGPVLADIMREKREARVISYGPK